LPDADRFIKLFHRQTYQYISTENVTNVPRYFIRVAALPCEILVPGKQQQPETCTVIYYTSHGNVAT